MIMQITELEVQQMIEQSNGKISWTFRVTEGFLKEGTSNLRIERGSQSVKKEGKKRCFRQKKAHENDDRLISLVMLGYYKYVSLYNLQALER